MFTNFDKAIAPLLVGVIFLGFNQFGITESTTVGQLVGIIVASIGVYFTPNKV